MIPGEIGRIVSEQRRNCVTLHRRDNIGVVNFLPANRMRHYQINQQVRNGGILIGDMKSSFKLAHEVRERRGIRRGRDGSRSSNDGQKFT